MTSIPEFIKIGKETLHLKITSALEPGFDVNFTLINREGVIRATRAVRDHREWETAIKDMTSEIEANDQR